LTQAGDRATSLLDAAALEDAGLARPALTPIVNFRPAAGRAVDQWIRAEAAESWPDDGESQELLGALARTVVEARTATGCATSGVLGAGPPRPRWLASWTTKDWAALESAAVERLQALVSAADGARAEVLRILADAADVAASETELARPAADERTALRALDEAIRSGEVAFDEALLLGAPSGGVETSVAVPVTGGGGGSRGAPVSADQQRRGRLAEWFAMERCWHQFLQREREERAAVVDARLEARSRTEPVAWGTREAHRGLDRAVRTRRSSLVAGSDRELFHGLIDVSAERGPGFDLLDPFDASGYLAEVRRVEVKALDPAADQPRVVLTTNEFHKARLDPDSYVLRLVAVPVNGEDLGGIHWVADVPDPVAALDLESAFLVGVRGGQAGVRLQLR